MAESQTTVARPQLRLLLLLIACLLGLATLVTRSREPKPPAPTGLSVPAQVRMSAPMRLGGAPLVCQEVRLSRDRLGVRVYSTDASLSHRSDDNLYFWVDVQLLVDGHTVRGAVLGTPDDPFSMAAGATTVTGLFDGTPPLDVRPRSRTALVTSAGSPVEVPEGTLAGCDLSFVAVRTF